MLAEVRPRGGTAPVSCRPIGEADLGAVVALLTRGFPERSPDYWRRGFERHASSPIPEGHHRYGYLLEAEARPVGVILTLYASVERGGRAHVRCNLSSWYVDPAFRGYAILLDNVAIRDKTTTYVNISAAPRTWPMHEARGFRRYCGGQMLAFPLASPARPGVEVRAGDGAGTDALRGLSVFERRLLADHAAYGCVCLVATDADETAPFVFVRRPVDRIKYKLGWSPLGYFHLVYCRATQDLPRFAHAIGRHLLRHHAMPWIVVDASAPIAGLRGRFLDGVGTKFQRGPDPVPLGDLAYTELVLFGP